MICKICKGVLEHGHNLLIDFDTQGSPYDFSSQLKYGHHRTAESLHASVNTGCWLCIQLDTSFNGDEKDPLPELESGDLVPGNTSSYFLTIITIHRPTLPSRTILIDLDNRQKWGHLCFAAMEPLTTDDGGSFLYQDIKHTSCVDSLPIVERWLSECSKTHTECNSVIPRDSWFPTRLIDLGDPNASAEQSRLVITKENPPVGVYASLSHCWGQAKIIQLQKSNLDEFRHALPLADMPKTFLDAMTVCKGLKIRYLWIDSLCIMQDKDDLSDWSREAGFMHKVYSFSHLNISASDAPDATHGLLRNHAKPALRRLTVRESSGDESSVLKDFFVHEIYDLGNHWTNDVESSPIKKRGWVFQERLLAPRVIHFSNTQIYWECRKKSTCETFPNLDFSTIPTCASTMYQPGLDYKYYMAKAAVQELEPEELAACYNIWDRIVGSYVHTKTTESKDKLVAISGIANHFRSILKDTYIAGMWRQNLESQLTWDHNDMTGRSSRPKDYRAPTWSWASIDGTITTCEKRYTPLELKVSVEDVQITYKTHDVTGEIDSGYLDLRGHLKVLHLIGRDTEPLKLNMNVNGVEQDLFSMVDMDVLDWHFIQELRRDSAAYPLFYMPIYHTGSRSCAIIVQPVHDQPGTFTRIGKLTFGPDFLDPEFWAAIQDDIDQDPPETLPCLRYEGGKHTIRII